MLFSAAGIFAQPVITSFDPLSGPVGTTVTISGENFNAMPANNIVFFGATMTEVTAGTDSVLTVTVQEGTTYDYITVTDLDAGLTAYSTLPFITTFTCDTTIDSTSFDEKIDSSTGTQPLKVSTGDLDGDGKPDIITANYSSNTVSVLKNTSTAGNISFDTKEDFTTGSGPGAAATGDLNGDGKPDIATANDWSQSVSVLKNTSTPGTISFASKADFPAGNSLTNISIADIDGDGRPDIIITNPGGGGTNTSVMRNIGTAGSISFDSPVNLVTGEWPSSISIGDIDGDGKPDIAVTSNFSTFVTVLRNTSTPGNISFAAKDDYTTSGDPTGGTIGDIDGDGKLDIIVTNGNTPTVSVFKNTSTPGAISFAPKADFATGSYPLGPATGDIDGDGKPDIAVANLSANTVSVLKDTGTAGNISFAAKVDYTTGSSPLKVLIVDLDGDGKPDLAAVNQYSNSVSVLRNNLQCTSVGTKNLTVNNEEIKIYPNPFHSQTTVYFSQPTTGSISIYTINGQLVLQTHIDKATHKQIVLSGVPAGIYIVKVISESSVHLNKIVVE